MQTTLVQAAPAGTTQERAEQLLAQSFGPGSTGPLTVLFDGEGAAQAAAQVRPQVAGLPGVVLVTDPVPSPDGSAALLSVVPASGPSDAATERLVADLRGLLGGVEGAQASVTGATAVSVDVARTLDEALPVYLLLVVGLALVLLVLVFRSLLVPLVGVLGFLLTIGASLGATVAVFQWGWGAELVNVGTTGPLLSLTPILVIGILFGLAMDYQVFLVSRMHEAHRAGAGPLDAIRTGFRQAAPVVVAAAGHHVRSLRRLRAVGRRGRAVDRLRAGRRHPVRRLRGAHGPGAGRPRPARRARLVAAARAAVAARARRRGRRAGGAGRARARAQPQPRLRGSGQAAERSGSAGATTAGPATTGCWARHTDQPCSSVMDSSARARRRGAVVLASWAVPGPVRPACLRDRQGRAGG